MLSPVGYTPLSEINAQGLWDESLSHDDLAKLIFAAGSVFATSLDGRSFKLSGFILATHLGRFAFIDAGRWSISLPEWRWDESEAIRGDLQLFAGGFTAVDAEYDERLGKVWRANAILRMKDSDADDRLPDGVPDDLLSTFSELDGSPIYMVDEDFTNFMESLKTKIGGLSDSPRPIKHASSLDVELAFKEFIKPYKESRKRPRENTSGKQWWQRNSLNRDQYRELLKRFGHESWSSGPGRPRTSD